MKSSYILVVFSVMTICSFVPRASAVGTGCTTPASDDVGCYKCNAVSPADGSVCEACMTGFYYNGMTKACVALATNTVCPKPAG